MGKLVPELLWAWEVGWVIPAPRGNDAMSRESSPLWVWLAIGLIVPGSVGYVGSVFFMEYLMAAFG